jgi:HEXXH motif-containing protein
MESIEKVNYWIKYPFPLWDPNVTESLIENYVLENALVEYNIASLVTKSYFPSRLIPLTDNKFPSLELPSVAMDAFYEEHDLEPELLASPLHAIQKLNKAFDVIRFVQVAFKDVNNLIKTIQIIQSSHHDTDISYSHPEIPFSIFLSVCQENTPMANLRVAESIIHEAMHLKLTLIERLIPLIDEKSKITFFSPWRDEERPVRGVLHGLFVFRTLLEFFEEIKFSFALEEQFKFIENRIRQIRKEISLIRDFENCSALTESGKILTKNLLYSSLV